MAGFDGPPEKNAGKRAPGRPFKKGNPGGPGRPKGISLTRVLREVLESQGEDAARKRMAKWLKMADEGNQTILREIWDRIDGKVPDKVLTGELTMVDLDWGDTNGSTADEDTDAATSPEAAVNRLGS